MANIQERRDKNGKLISYSIRVHRGVTRRESSSSRGRRHSMFPQAGRKKAREKRPRLTPRPLKRNAERALPLTAARNLRRTANM